MKKENSNMENWLLISVKITVAIFLIATPVKADLNSGNAEISGVKFPLSYSIEKKKLTLRGYAVLNYMYVIKAYAGAFYLEEGKGRADALGKSARILELEYFRNIKGEDFAEATEVMIKKNVTPARYQAMKERVDRFNSLYRDVKPGDRYRALYIPGRGTSLYHNNRLISTTKGDDFAFAFFSVWLGKNPIDKNFRSILLGK